jgi:Zn-dependent M28 family amino/carboxypeptidase
VRRSGPWLALGICFLLVGSTCWRHPGDPVLAAVRAPDGMGQRAYRHVAALCAIGPRFTSSMGWSQGLGYITGQLLELGLEPQKDTWVDELENLAFTNISVTIKGSSSDKIVIGCHHDTKRCSGHADAKHNFEFVGANDSGSGVGLLLELARVLRDRPTRATYELVFFDGEESLTWAWDEQRALFGSKRYVRRYQQARLDDAQAPIIRAFILLDMIGAKDLHIDDDTNSDPELKRIFGAAAKACGHGKYFYANRLAVSDDHLPFIRSTPPIPAIDLIDLHDNPQWHEATDTLEHISADSLHLLGEVVLTALPAIEARYFSSPEPR